MKNKTYNRKKTMVVFFCAVLLISALFGRLVYLMIFDAAHYQKLAKDLHERERKIKAARGEIVDRNGVVLATNRTVCTISVIHNQMKDPEQVIAALCQELGEEEENIRKKVEKVSSMEKIKTNVEKETGDRIRNLDLAGVKVDEDFKRYYPYDTLASRVLGFTGGDNQGIIGLEVKYEEVLKGTNGTILTVTDARGVELEKVAEDRIEPVAGNTLQISLDHNIQKYCEQAAKKVQEEKQADSVSVLLMNPQDGEIFAMVNTPEFNLNTPFELIGVDENTEQTDEQTQEMLNQMWRNPCINDTYEPGSIFKMVTATAALETGSVTLNDHFTCGGSAIVADRKIRCHKTTGHGTQTFTQTVMNSCNPAFIEWGRRVGTERFFEYMGKLGLLEKTGIDIAGEASTIIHKQENVGEVELATMSFGQSFQITPLQMLRAASAIINGGNLVTPHFAVKSVSEADGTAVEFNYEIQSNAIEEKTSLMMKDILRQVVEEGGGKKAYLEGFSIGGKTATSQKLPRGSGKYISSFIGFSPVDNAKVIAMCLIDEPQGIYYGGTIAAPVIRELFENILPYLEIQNN